MIGRMSAEHIALAGPAQPHGKGPIDRVGGHPLKRHAGRERSLDHRGGDLRLGDKADRIGHVSRGKALGLRRPVLRQIQLTVDEGAALVGDIGGKHADLATGDLARRSGVLPAHATRVLTLLEKAGLVDHQHRSGRGQRLQRILAHHVPQGIRVPVAAAEHRLLAPRPRITCGFSPHPAGLAPLRPEQPIEEGSRRGRNTRMSKQDLR